MHVPVLPKSEQVDDATAIRNYELESPAFLHFLLNLELPESNLGLYLPVIRTPWKEELTHAVQRRGFTL